MEWKSLIVGACVGIGIGWMLFAQGSDPTGRAPGPTLETDAPAAGPQLEGTGGPPPTPNSGAGAGSLAADAPDVRPAPSVGELEQRVTAARERGDWQTFRAALYGLARSQTAEAQGILMRLLDDLDLRFRERVGTVFHEGLQGSRDGAVAGAARRRFLQQVESGKTSWVATDGWFELVADHGNAADIAWLAARQESGQIASRAIEAIAKSDNEHALRFMLSRLEETGNVAKYDRELRTFADHHPAEAFDLVSGLLARPFLPGHMNRSEIIITVGRVAPPDRLPEAKALIRSLRSEQDRLWAVSAIQRLHDRGLDVSDLQDMLALPLDVLRALDPDDPRGTTPQRVFAAWSSLEHNRLAWSERAVRALEDAADRLEGSRAVGVQAPRMRQSAATIRAGLASPWKD